MSEDPAKEFYRRAGIVRHETPSAFWRELTTSCGEAVTDEVERLMQRRVHGDVAPSDIELFTSDTLRQRVTIDAVAPHTWTWMNALATVTDIRAALDLGCGGGVVTCFMALHNPHARVVGVDSNAVAIDAARALSRELELTNVEFFVADVVGLDLHESFDLVVSSAVWAETEPWVHAQRWWSSLNQLPVLLSGGIVPSRLAETAARHLEESGVYLSLERCRDLAGLGAWIASLQSVGLNFDTAMSDMLTINGVLTGPERLPMVAVHRGTLPAGVQDVVQWRLSVGDVRLDESLMTEMVMANGSEWSLVSGRIFDASEDGDRFSVALLLLERGDEGKLYFATTRGVREILASSPDGGAGQFVALYERMCDHLGQRPSVVAERGAEAADVREVLPRLVAA